VLFVLLVSSGHCSVRKRLNIYCPIFGIRCRRTQQQLEPRIAVGSIGPLFRGSPLFVPWDRVRSLPPRPTAARMDPIEALRMSSV